MYIYMCIHVYIYVCIHVYICVYEESYQYNAASKGNVELQTRIFGLPRPQLHRSPAGSWTGGVKNWHAPTSSNVPWSRRWISMGFN